MKKSFVVIGLGRFGGSVTKTLIEQGQEVLAIDKDETRINEYMNIATHAVVANAEDENVLKTLGVRNFDGVIVSIGEDIQASILVTLMVKEAGVKNVWAKATNDYHARVLEKIGADRVVHPERDMGARIAHRMTAKNLLDYLELSEKFSMGEIKVSSNKITNQTLMELNLTKKFGIFVAAIRRKNGDVELAQAKSVINQGDNILVLGSSKQVERFD
jgi:trk system potassium uptake protein TrkA